MVDMKCDRCDDIFMEGEEVETIIPGTVARGVFEQTEGQLVVHADGCDDD